MWVWWNVKCEHEPVLTESIVWAWAVLSMHSPWEVGLIISVLQIEKQSLWGIKSPAPGSLNCIPLLQPFAYLFICHELLYCFPILAVVNNAAVNIGGKISLQTLLSILLHVYPEMKLLDRMVILILVFWGNILLFSTAASSFHISTSKCMRVLISLHLHQCLLLLF